MKSDAPLPNSRRNFACPCSPTSPTYILQSGGCVNLGNAADAEEWGGESGEDDTTLSGPSSLPG